MAHEHDSTQPESPVAGQAARRRFLKVVGAAALAVPVIESVTGKDILTTSAQAATAGPDFLSGPFTGTVALNT